MNNSKSINIDNSAELLRILACIGIVIIHVSDQIILKQNVNLFLWNVANIVEGCFRFSVPVFLMMSGAFNIGKNIEKILKNLMRLFIIYVVWSAGYVIFYGELFHFKITFQSFNVIFKFNASYQLWYFKALFLMYFGIIVVNIIKDNITEKNFDRFLKGYIILWLIITIPVYYLASQYSNIYSITNKVFFEFFSYLGWALCGYFIKQRKNKRILGIVLFFIGLSMTVFIRKYYAIQNPNIWNGYPYSNFSIGLMLESIGIFSVFINGSILKNKNIRKIGKLTLGVYLIHTAFLSIICNTNLMTKLNVLKHLNIGTYFFETISIIIISFITIYLITKVKYIKFLV